MHPFILDESTGTKPYKVGTNQILMNRSMPSVFSGGFRGTVAPHLPSQDIQKDGCVVIKGKTH